MSIEAWPFLVSRNKKIGYRTVVAPQFLCDQRATNILAEAAGGDATEEDFAFYREIYGSKVGDITLVFRVVRAENRDIGLQGNEILTDQYGRPIDLVEGIVLKGIVPDVVVTSADLQLTHEQVKKVYQQFWDDTVNFPAVNPSTSFRLQINRNAIESGNLRLKKEAPFSIKPSIKTKEQWLNEGIVHFEAEHYEDALAAYDQALSLDPNFARAYIKKGQTLNSLKRYKAALEVCEQAIRLDSKDASAFFYKGNALYNLKRDKEAITAYDQALSLDPNFARAYNNKGITLYFLKRFDEAIIAYDQALSLDPNFARAYNNKGDALYFLKRFDEAIIAYDQALSLDPNFADSYIIKGNALYQIGYYEDALKAYEKAIQIVPSKAVLYRYKGDALSKLGKLDEARQANEKADQLDYKIW